MKQPIHVSAAMHKANIIVGGGSWLKKVGLIGLPRLEQAIMNHPVFPSGKNMRTNRQVVILAVNKAER